jgi:hypothetical protein
MLKRTCKPYFSKLNSRMEHAAIDADKAGHQDVAIRILDQSDFLLKNLAKTPRDQRRRIKRELKRQARNER